MIYKYRVLVRHLKHGRMIIPVTVEADEGDVARTRARDAADARMQRSPFAEGQYSITPGDPVSITRSPVTA
jgi:hypothetical protein